MYNLNLNVTVFQFSEKHFAAPALPVLLVPRITRATGEAVPLKLKLKNDVKRLNKKKIYLISTNLQRPILICRKSICA